MERGRSILVIGTILLCSDLASGQEPRDRVRFDLERASVVFHRGSMSSAHMEDFAHLVEQGIRDVESYLSVGARGVVLNRERLTFHVSSRVRISRARDRTVLLPLRRVESRSAPYLHEVAHALLPGRNGEVWLNEGYASYVESWVAENVGGYAAHVFSRAGNTGIDRDAARHLGTPHGQRALEYVGREGTPRGFYRDRERVAAPLYVLSHSFFKYLVENTSLDHAVRLLEADAAAPALERSSGRSLESWKHDWLRSLRVGVSPQGS